MTHTSNYSLTQWEAQDRILMADFNTDNAKIDAALQSHAASIAGKAAQADLNAEIAARKAAVSAEESARKSAVAAEEAARKKAVSDEIAARTAAINTLTTNTNNALALCGNCQIYYTTYTGNGEVSRSFTFPHKPMALFLFGDGYTHHAILDTGSIGAQSGVKLNAYLNITWSDRTLTWNYQDSPAAAMNTEGRTYFLLALLAMDQ